MIPSLYFFFPFQRSFDLHQTHNELFSGKGGLYNLHQSSHDKAVDLKKKVPLFPQSFCLNPRLVKDCQAQLSVKLIQNMNSLPNDKFWEKTNSKDLQKTVRAIVWRCVRRVSVCPCVCP